MENTESAQRKRARAAALTITSGSPAEELHVPSPHSGFRNLGFQRRKSSGDTVRIRLNPELWLLPSAFGLLVPRDQQEWRSLPFLTWVMGPGNWDKVELLINSVGRKECKRSTGAALGSSVSNLDKK